MCLNLWMTIWKGHSKQNKLKRFTMFLRDCLHCLLLVSVHTASPSRLSLQHVAESEQIQSDSVRCNPCRHHTPWQLTQSGIEFLIVRPLAVFSLFRNWDSQIPSSATRLLKQFVELNITDSVWHDCMQWRRYTIAGSDPQSWWRHFIISGLPSL